MNDRVFQAAFDALTKALIKGGHLAGFSLEERDEITAALVDAISPAVHKDLHEQLDRQARAIEWIRTIAGGGDRLPSEWADPWRKRAEEAEARLLQIESAQDPNNPYWRLRSDRHEATVARVKALAEDMRTWCSPHGIAVTYAQHIDEAIEPPGRNDLPAVRAFAAEHDPRGEALPNGYLADAMRRAVEQMARDVQRRMDGGPK